MSSWWRKIAVARGFTAGSGSWKRRVATALVTAQPGLQGANWPRILATHGSGTFQTTGSWTRRLTAGSPTPSSGSWARNLFQGGGPG